MFAKPEDLKEREIIKASRGSVADIQFSQLDTQEFHVRCRASQELIFAQIPWATAGAERSRDLMTVIAEKRSDSHPKAPPEATTEEQLLAALLVANEEIIEALRLYDDMQRMTLYTDEVLDSDRLTLHSKVRIRPRRYLSHPDARISIRRLTACLLPSPVLHQAAHHLPQCHPVLHRLRTFHQRPPRHLRQLQKPTTL